MFKSESKKFTVEPLTSSLPVKWATHSITNWLPCNTSSCRTMVLKCC